MSFFPLSIVSDLKKPIPLAARCGACGLFRTCNTPKMEPYGKGERKILVIGEAPGETEDNKGVPFVGKTGKMLRDTLEKFGVNPKRDTIMTNALICRPPGNRIRDKKMIAYCRPNVVKLIRSYEPEVVILVGGIAMQSLLGFLWKENLGTIGTWVGWQIPCHPFNCWVCPTFHPSYVIREEKYSPIPQKMFEEHIEKAVSLKGKPWKIVPDFKKEVEIIYDSRDAAKAIRSIIKVGRDVAFDFETTGLKGNGKDSSIVACSLSNGKRTIAFPFAGEAIEATKEMVTSDLPKIASNIKYEHLWCQSQLGVEVKNWKHCTMASAHILDNRSSITSIKFQAFVLLGQEPYNDHIAPYLKSKEPGGYALNRIKEIDLSDLLLYCGLDSLLEWKVAAIQRKELSNG